jgi:hypothetical protein
MVEMASRFEMGSERPVLTSFTRAQMFDEWKWRDETGSARAREALIGVCFLSAFVVFGLLGRLVAMSRRRKKGSFEVERRRRVAAEKREA